jgi:hypothetical protein
MATKVSKKEKKAKKVQEKAQFAEIDRRLEQERRQTEAAEVARLKLEAKLAYEAEQAWLKAEEERLAEESQSMRSFLEWRNTTLAKLEAEALAVTDVSPRSLSHSALCKSVDSVKMCRLLKKCHGFFLPARRERRKRRT